MTEPMKLYLRVPPCGRLDDIADFAVEVEKAGFTGAWFPDSQFLFRDVWATMAVAARATSTLSLGTAVANFETRNVSVTAAAASTIAESAPGRVVIGMGTGQSAVKSLGIAPTKLAAMRENVGVLRALLQGQSVPVAADEGKLLNPSMKLGFAPSRPVPIYIGAIGPKMTELAGAIADGVIIQSGCSAQSVARNIERVARGAALAGRDPAEIDIVVGAHTIVAADYADAIRRVKPLVVQTAQQGGHGPLAAIGIEVAVPPVIKEVYPDMGHAEDWDLAVEVAGQWITDDMAEKYARHYAMVGTRASVKERLEELSRLGVNGFFAIDVASYTLPYGLLDAFRTD